MKLLQDLDYLGPVRLRYSARSLVANAPLLALAGLLLAEVERTVDDVVHLRQQTTGEVLLALGEAVTCANERARRENGVAVTYRRFSLLETGFRW